MSLTPPFVRRWLARRAPGDRLTREHVVWGYRLFLDREPENDEVVLGKVKSLASTRALRYDFLTSYEFVRNNPEIGGGVSDRAVVIAEIGGGLRLYVDLADQLVGLAIARGVYEPEERAFVEAIAGRETSWWTSARTSASSRWCWRRWSARPGTSTPSSRCPRTPTCWRGRSPRTASRSG